MESSTAVIESLEPMLPDSGKQGWNNSNPEQTTTSRSIVITPKQDQTSFKKRNSFRRLVTKSGESNISNGQITGPGTGTFVGLFTWLVDAKWRWTGFIFFASFYVTWTMFAVLFWLICYFHGDFETKESRQHVFSGAYETKVSSIALAKLLHHGVTTNDSRITEITITVEDDSDLTDGDGCIRTRSQRGALQYRVKEISILVKILKLLIYELSNCLESAMAFADDDDDNDTDGEQSVEGMRENAGALLSTQLLNDEDKLDDLKDDDDPDAQHDPNSVINLQQYLTEFLRSFSSQSYFPSGFLPHLNSQEKQVLNLIGIHQL